MGSTLDLLPTIASLTKIPLPRDRKYDGYDLSGILRGSDDDPRKEMLYYHGTRIFAARKGDFKMHFYKNNPLGYPEKMEKLDTVTLYNLQHDPSEKYNIAADNLQIIKEIELMVQTHQATLEQVGTQLEKKIAQK
jgi:arylsulfatase A-like enzyme